MAKGSIDGMGGSSAISTMISTFGNKLWFQIIVAFWLIIGPILFVANPFLSNYLNSRANAKENIERVEYHRESFEASKQAYAVIKKTMNEYLSKIGCDYMFLIEYHNGNENVMTGIQFCRFDMTVQVSSADLSYIALEKFRDDIVARYDILLSDELSTNKLLCFNEDEFDKSDRYLAQQLNSINAKSYSIINLVDKNNKVFGSLLCISITEETKNTNHAEIVLCAREIESVFCSVDK